MSDSSLFNYILENLKDLTLVDDFLPFRKYLIIDDFEFNSFETELFQHMVKYKQLAQLALNIYHNHSYVQNCQIWEDNQSNDLDLFVSRHNLRIHNSANTSIIKPDMNTLVGYLIQYISYYVKLEKYEQQKNFNDIKSLMRSLCFYCDNNLDNGRCQVCATNSMDMRDYALRHHRTLRKLKTRQSTDTKSKYCEIILESDQHTPSTKQYCPPTQKRSLGGIIDSMLSKEDWVCRSCSFINTGDSANCHTCFRLNEYAVIKPYPQSAISVLKNFIQETFKDTDHSMLLKTSLDSYSCLCSNNCNGVKIKWRCWNPKCYKIIENCANYCTKCGIQRRIGRKIYRRNKMRLEEMWVCDICSEINNGNDLHCSVCPSGKKNGCTKFWRQ